MKTTQEKTIIKDLGAGLILRRSTPEDADALASYAVLFFALAVWRLSVAEEK